MSRMAVLAVALLSAAGLSWATQVPVSIVDFAFSPDTVRVNPGDSVTWTNNGTYTHTSTSGTNGTWDSLWDSGDMVHGATFIHGFPIAGTFDYFCRHHSSMKGAIVVGTGGVNETPGTCRNSDGIVSYPNPFRARMTMRVVPSGSVWGSVEVFNASGKLVRTLPVAQTKSVIWDGKDDGGQETGPGVYFCRYGSGALAVTRLR